MRIQTLLLTLITLAVVTGCGAAPARVTVEVKPLPVRTAGTAGEIVVRNQTDKNQVVVVGSPIYVMTVLDPKGQQVVRKEIRNVKPETIENLGPNTWKEYSFIWEGKDQAGQSVPPGTYTVKLNFNASHNGKQLTVPDQKVEIK